jgi:hypothetical protein
MESPTFKNNKGLTSNTVALPKGEGAFSLLPEGEGLGMRGERYLHYAVTAVFRIKNQKDVCSISYFFLFINNKRQG